MGRSFLSVKLAFAFGVCVGVLVLVTDSVLAGGPERAPAVAEQPALVPAQDAAAESQVAAEPDLCLWRGCPAVLAHPLVRTAAPHRQVAPARRGDLPRAT
jgi:hypothetical protein